MNGFFSYGKDRKQSSKRTFITFWLWLQQQVGRDHTSEESQGTHSSPSSHGPAAAAPPPPGSGLRQLPALITRERKTLQTGSDRRKCFLPIKFYIFSTFWVKFLKAIFLCQWISSQIFYLSYSDLLEFLKSKNSMKVNKLLHSYVFNKNSLSKDQQPMYSAEGMCEATKAGREDAWVG